MKGFFSKINPCPFEVFSSLLGLNESQMSNTAAIPSLASTITLETEVRLGVTLKRPYRTVCMCVWETWEVGEIVVRGKTWDIRRGWSADRCVCLPICFSHCWRGTPGLCPCGLTVLHSLAFSMVFIYMSVCACVCECAVNSKSGQLGFHSVGPFMQSCLT